MAWFGFGFVTPAAEEAGGDPVAALDAWTDNGTGVSLGAAGSKTVSASPGRVTAAPSWRRHPPAMWPQR
jgi:hypothetical protein